MPQYIRNKNRKMKVLPAQVFSRVQAPVQVPVQVPVQAPAQVPVQVPAQIPGYYLNEAAIRFLVLLVICNLRHLFKRGCVL